MSDPSGRSGDWLETSARAVARDTLLHLAAVAEAVLDVDFDKMGVQRRPASGEGLFQDRLAIHLRAAAEGPSDDIRGKHLGYAADLIEFCAAVGTPLTTDEDVLDLRRDAHAALSAVSTHSGLVSDLTSEVTARLALGRSHRLQGGWQQCHAVLDRRPADFFGTGAEHLHWEFAAQRAAAYIEERRPASVDSLDEKAKWADEALARAWPTERRYDLMHALAAPTPHAAYLRLDAVRDEPEEQTIARPDPISVGLAGGAIEIDPTRRDIRGISFLLSHADAAASLLESADHRAGDLLVVVAADLSNTLVVLSGLRVRWRVVARSRSPLARAFHRIYGEIARIAARLDTAAGAEVGLRVALAVKHTGFAQLLRADAHLLEGVLATAIQRVSTIENRLGNATLAGKSEAADVRELERWGSWLEREISPLFAQLALPPTSDLQTLASSLSDVQALDFVLIEDALGEPAWFRTWLRDGQPFAFDRVEFEPATIAYLDGDAGQEAAYARLAGTDPKDVMWWEIASNLVPAALLAELAATPEERPARLLISPHDRIALIPWPTLHLNARGRLLVDAAVLTQIPVLTFPEGPLAAGAVGPGTALAWLDPDETVITSGQRGAWSAQYPDGHFAACDLATRTATPRHGRLSDSLSRDRRETSWALVHVTCHGDGTGLLQRLQLSGGDLLAAQAMGLGWPESVILAACYSGRVESGAEVEPFGFVTAAMVGGARTVLGGLLNLSAGGTEALLTKLLPRIRPGTALPAELRLVQREMSSEDVTRWALMTAFVR